MALERTDSGYWSLEDCCGRRQIQMRAFSRPIDEKWGLTKAQPSRGRQTLESYPDPPTCRLSCGPRVTAAPYCSPTEDTASERKVPFSNVKSFSCRPAGDAFRLRAPVVC